MNTSLRFLLVAVAAAFVLAACGRPENPPATSGPAAARTADGRRSVELTADDTMKFNLAEIAATPGEPLRLTLRNTGRMPKQAMAHNWVLLKPMADTELTAFGTAAAAKAPDYLPADRAAVLATTKLVGAGESDTIEFAAPAAPGVYPFLCTFPGHFAFMRGKLIVK